MHQNAALISRQIQRIVRDFSLTPITASEIEFYLIGADASSALGEVWRDIANKCADAGIEIYKTDRESGFEQFEVALKPGNPVKTAIDTQILKNIITSVAYAHSMEANFLAKSFADQPGSGLHINLHLTDSQGKNIFYKSDAAISLELKHSIGGLLAWLNPCVAVFAPDSDSFARFAEKSNAPLTVSWGGNNRTVAIRLPDTEHDNKRIEHRVAGCDADPELVIAVILAAIHYGLKNKCDPGAPIFGDASLPMYHLPRIISTREDAVKCLQETAFIREYFSVEDLLPTPS